MAQFLYWIPDVDTVKPDDAISAGLAYALEDRLTPRGCASGPDGRRGCTVVHGGNDDGRLGYWPDRQIWRQIPGSHCWCGMYRDMRPIPGELARAQQISGQWVTLDDGHRWLLPKARRWLEIDEQILWDYNLPRRLKLDDDGLWMPGPVKPKYERLWTLAAAYDEAASVALSTAADDDNIVRFDFENIDELAVSAMQMNYRVGPVELDLLGVYDDTARQLIIDVLLDNGTLHSWLKKKLDESVQSGESS